MKLSTLIALSLVFVTSSAWAEAPIVGFQSWKAARIDEARANLDQAKKPEGSKAKAEQAQLSLDVAQELTVTDYFLLYLRQLKNREAIVEAAKRLTPEDTADLILSYQKHLAGSQEVDVIVPASAQLTPSAPTSVTK